jgi:hypothetical protein
MLGILGTRLTRCRCGCRPRCNPGCLGGVDRARGEDGNSRHGVIAYVVTDGGIGQDPDEVRERDRLVREPEGLGEEGENENFRGEE